MRKGVIDQIKKKHKLLPYLVVFPFPSKWLLATTSYCNFLKDDYGLAMGRRRLPNIPQQQIPYQVAVVASEENLQRHKDQSLSTTLLRTLHQRSRSDIGVHRAGVSGNIQQQTEISPYIVSNSSDYSNTSASIDGIKAGQNLFDYTAEKQAYLALQQIKKETTPIKSIKTSSALQQQKSEPTVSHSDLLTLSTTYGRLNAGKNISATLARVLLKQELKDALTFRRQQLEASEIEANQREYAVKQMLLSGRYHPLSHYGEGGVVRLL